METSIPEKARQHSIQSQHGTFASRGTNDHSISTEQASQRIYQTVLYACGHAMLRATFRMNLTLKEVNDLPREIHEPFFYCPLCKASRTRAIERKLEAKIERKLEAEHATA